MAKERTGRQRKPETHETRVARFNKLLTDEELLRWFGPNIAEWPEGIRRPATYQPDDAQSTP